MSSTIEELLPFDCLNFTDFCRRKPLFCKQWMEFNENNIVYIYDHGLVMHVKFHQDIICCRGVIAL